MITIYVDVVYKKPTNLCSQLSAWKVIASFRTLYTCTYEVHYLAIHLFKFPIPV